MYKGNIILDFSTIGTGGEVTLNNITNLFLVYIIYCRSKIKYKRKLTTKTQVQCLIKIIYLSNTLYVTLHDLIS